jgi:hypothetical protein
MNPSASNPAPQHEYLGADSLDTEIFVFDGPSDTTVRPPDPVLLKWYMAERERLAKLGFNLDGTPIKPPDANESK